MCSGNLVAPSDEKTFIININLDQFMYILIFPLFFCAMRHCEVPPTSRGESLCAFQCCLDNSFSFPPTLTLSFSPPKLKHSLTFKHSSSHWL